MRKECIGCESVGVCGQPAVIDCSNIIVGGYTHQSTSIPIVAGPVPHQDIWVNKEWLQTNPPDIILFTKVGDVKTPVRGTSHSAGIDFFVPNDFASYNLAPQERILIPSGIKVKIPKGHALIMFNKSGVASKKGLDVLACVIDEDYLLEVHINLVNTSDHFVVINPGEKIVQGILIPMNYAEVREISNDEFLKIKPTERTGGFGSTGNY